MPGFRTANTFPSELDPGQLPLILPGVVAAPVGVSGLAPFPSCFPGVGTRAVALLAAHGQEELPSSEPRTGRVARLRPWGVPRSPISPIGTVPERGSRDRNKRGRTVGGGTVSTTWPPPFPLAHLAQTRLQASLRAATRTDRRNREVTVRSSERGGVRARAGTTLGASRVSRGQAEGGREGRPSSTLFTTDPG